MTFLFLISIKLTIVSSNTFDSIHDDDLMSEVTGPAGEMSRRSEVLANVSDYL